MKLPAVNNLIYTKTKCPPSLSSHKPVINSTTGKRSSYCLKEASDQPNYWEYHLTYLNKADFIGHFIMLSLLLLFLDHVYIPASSRVGLWLSTSLKGRKGIRSQSFFLRGKPDGRWWRDRNTGRHCVHSRMALPVRQVLRKAEKPAEQVFLFSEYLFLRKQRLQAHRDTNPTTKGLFWDGAL